MLQRKVTMLGTGILALILAGAFAFSVSAQEPPVPEGKWVFVPQGSDNIEDRIESATAHLSFVIRGIGRSRLRNANLPISEVVISYPNNQVHISLQANDPPIITPQDGSYVPYTRADGEVVQAKTELKEGYIRQFFDSDDGKKEIIYRIRPDGTMALETTVFSERLKEPFRYTWIFRKQ